MRRTRATSVPVLVCALALYLVVSAASSAEAVPRRQSGTVGVACVPTVGHPAPATSSSPPFAAVLQAPRPAGWVDEDLFLSCSSPEITYTTAVFVRAPADSARASGIVAVDPLHSAGIWGMQTLLQPYFVAHGDVHIGVVASHDTVELVKRANPTRYASLDIPATPDATNEILAGVGVLLHQRPESLVPGVRVHDAILGGWSQTAVVTRSFISSPEMTPSISFTEVLPPYKDRPLALAASIRAMAWDVWVWPGIRNGLITPLASAALIWDEYIMPSPSTELALLCEEDRPTL